MKLRTFKTIINGKTYRARDLPATAALRLGPVMVGLLSPELIGAFVTKIQETPKGTVDEVLEHLTGADIFMMAQIVAKQVQGDALTDFLRDFFRSCEVVQLGEDDIELNVADNFDEVFSRDLKSVFLVGAWVAKEVFS